MPWGGRSRSCALALLLALGAPGLGGCGTSVYSVRAGRAFANEDAVYEVVRARTEALERALELSESLLVATPYAPGDTFPTRLALDDDAGASIRRELEAKPPYLGGHEVPLVDVYGVHLLRSLRGADEERLARPRERRSLLEAAEQLAPDIALRAPFAALSEARAAMALARDPVARADAGVRLAEAMAMLGGAAAEIARAPVGSAEQATVARDVLAAVSVALRVSEEALAVVPYVVMHGKRLGGEPSSKLVERARRAGDLAADVQAAMTPLAEVLAQRAGVALADSAGFAMRESLIAQAFAVNLASVRLHARAESELFFFHHAQSNVASTGINDYTGRTRRLAYAMDPIFVVGGRIAASYDFLNRKNAARLSAGFLTDRLVSSGGSIDESGSLGGILGLDGVVSDVVDIGGDLLGLRAHVKVATFTSGEVAELGIDGATGRDTGETRRAPLQLRYTQVDLGFDATMLAPELAEELAIEDFLVGFRHMDYRLPRVVYELVERDPGTGEVYVFSRESEPQSVRSRFYMGGFAMRLGRGDWARFAPFADLGVYGGAGPVGFRFPGEAATQATMLGLDATLALGLRARLTSMRARVRLLSELGYSAEVIAQGSVSAIRGTVTDEGTTYSVERKIDIGGVDVFHGPRLRVLLVY